LERPPGNGAAAKVAPHVGDPVEVKWEQGPGADNEYYNATVRAVYPDGGIDAVFDDDGIEAKRTRNYRKRQDPVSAVATPTAAATILAIVAKKKEEDEEEEEEEEKKAAAVAAAAADDEEHDDDASSSNDGSDEEQDDSASSSEEETEEEEAGDEEDEGQGEGEEDSEDDSSSADSDDDDAEGNSEGGDSTDEDGGPVGPVGPPGNNNEPLALADALPLRGDGRGRPRKDGAFTDAEFARACAYRQQHPAKARLWRTIVEHVRPGMATRDKRLIATWLSTRFPKPKVNVRAAASGGAVEEEEKEEEEEEEKGGELKGEGIEEMEYFRILHCLPSNHMVWMKFQFV